MIDVDGILHDWGERWDWSHNNPAKNQSRAGGGKLQFRFNSVGGGRRNIRSALNAIVRRTPQAVVKITGGGRGMKAMAVHLKYIAREGEVELIDEQGIKTRDLDGVEDLARGMEFGGGDVVPEHSNKREAHNVVLSMPPGTDRFRFEQAVNAFIKDEFDGCQYAIAHHVDEAHPHAHVMIKAVKLDGKRLNPRKGDIARWRAGFAGSLRAHGIEADATPRQARLERARGVSQARVHEAEKDRGRPQKTLKPGVAAATRRKQMQDRQGEAVATRRQAVKDLWAVHAALKSTNRGDDMKLARELSTMLRRKGYSYDYKHERTRALAARLDRGGQTYGIGSDRLRGVSPRDVAPDTRSHEANRVLSPNAPRDIQR